MRENWVRIYKGRYVFIHQKYPGAIDFSYIKSNGTLGRTISVEGGMKFFLDNFKRVDKAKVKIKIDFPNKKKEKNTKYLYINK